MLGGLGEAGESSEDWGRPGTGSGLEKERAGQVGF